MDISDSDWAALAGIKAGKLPGKAVIQRLAEIKYVTTTPRGDLRVTGLGNDALTLHKHGFKAPVEVEDELEEVDAESAEVEPDIEVDDAVVDDAELPEDDAAVEPPVKARRR